ncbi:tripartite tricarboxylate transporter TctB family protein [Nocardiopsis deserti]|uniref:tripartite tricarboxylate transporter TctB family protein n=1 Tax=Nocardiopsis deserti TaxID=2605988 RepID=UPI001CC229BF|nr:tripartite tricarboxylate transporter TctB family protein [Nocardiopsis deserti]
MTRERPAGVQSPDTDAETGPAAGSGSEAQPSARAETGDRDGTGSGSAVESATGDRAGTGAEGGSGTGAPEPGPAAGSPPATLGTALAVPAVTLVTALFLLVGGVVIRAPESSGFLGPQFFPLTVGALLGVTACVAGARAFLTVRRSPSARAAETATAPTSAEAATDADPVTDGAATDADATDDAKSAHGDWRTLGIMAATLTAHVLLLQPLGWLLSGTLLFWGVSFALDRRSPLLDLCVAVALAAIVQICFSGLLDVSLPSGLLGKVL